jgi:hypothetical protein
VFRQTQAVVSPTLHTLAAAPLAAGAVRHLRVDHAASPDAPAVQHFAFQVCGDETADDAAARRVGLLRLRHNSPGAGAAGVSAEACVLNVEPHESLVDLAFYQEKKPAAFYDGLQLSLLLQKVRALDLLQPREECASSTWRPKERKPLSRALSRDVCVSACVRTRASTGHKNRECCRVSPPPPVAAAHLITTTASPLAPAASSITRQPGRLAPRSS